MLELSSISLSLISTYIHTRGGAVSKYSIQKGTNNVLCMNIYLKYFMKYFQCDMITEVKADISVLCAAISRMECRQYLPNTEG